jgi:outer membrane protein TolC
MKLSRYLLFALLCLHPLSGRADTIEGSTVTTDESEELYCRQIKITSLVSKQLPVFNFCAPATTEVGRRAEDGNLTNQYSADKLVSIVDQAILKDNLVISQQLLIQSAAYGLKSAKGSWWPTASMSNSSLLFTDINAAQNYSGNPTTPSSPATAGSAFNPFNGSTTKDLPRRSSSSLTPTQQTSSTYTQAYPVITLQWNFMDPARYPQIAAAKKQVDLAKSQATETIMQRTDLLSRNIALYLLSGLRLGELNDLVTLQNQNYQESTRRVKAGVDPRLSRVQQFRNLLDYQSQMVAARIAQSNASIELNQALAKSRAASPNADTTKIGDVEDLINYLPVDQYPVSNWPYSLEETINRSLKESQDLKQLKLQAGIAIDNANQEWAGILPTIGILGYTTYQYTWGSQNYQPPSQPNGAFSASISNYIGLSVSWNLFDGHTNRNQAISYDRQSKSILSQYTDTKQQILVNVKSLYKQLSLLKQQISLNLADYEAATSIAMDMKVRTKYKFNTSNDNIQAMMDVHQSRLQLLSSLAQYLDVFAKLAIQAGLSPLTVR